MSTGIYKKTEEHKMKISVAMKGKKFSEEHRRKIGKTIKKQWKEGKRRPVMLGKHHSDETKTKMRKARLERKKQLGYINSSETKKKMSKVQKRRFKNNPMSEKTKKKLSTALNGKKKAPFTEEHRERLSEALKGKPQPWNAGEKCHFWKGGVSGLSRRIKISFRYKKWREMIFQRDDWICQKCGRRGGLVLHPHHKRSFSSILEKNNIKTLEDALSCEELWDINNGIALCNDCHKKTETYGWNNYNKMFKQEYQERKEYKIPAQV